MAKIKFLFEFNLSSKDQKTKLLNRCGTKFFKLVHEAKQKKYNSLDYEALPRIRQLLRKGKTLDKIMPVVLTELNEETCKDLIEISPLFNQSPVDLQAFILLSLGIRYIGNHETTTN